MFFPCHSHSSQPLGLARSLRASGLLSCRMPPWPHCSMPSPTCHPACPSIPLIALPSTRETIPSSENFPLDCELPEGRHWTLPCSSLLPHAWLTAGSCVGAEQVKQPLIRQEAEVGEQCEGRGPSTVCRGWPSMVPGIPSWGWSLEEDIPSGDAPWGWCSKGR